MLYAFAQRHSKLLKGVTYYVSGIIEQADGTEWREVKIVKEIKLKENLAKMIKVCSIHVYSVQLEQVESFKQNQDLPKNAAKEGLMNNFSTLTTSDGITKPTRPDDVASTELVRKSQTVKSIDLFSHKRSHQMSIKDFCSNMDHLKKLKSDGAASTLNGTIMKTVTSDWSESQLPQTTPKIEKIPTISGKVSKEGNQIDLLTEKYKPTSSNSITGQKDNIQKLKTWLQNWGKNSPTTPKCAMLSGPSGVGKTITIDIVCKELGFDVVEINASNMSNKKLIEESVPNTLHTTSLATMMHKTSVENTVSKKRVLLMEEVDCLIGNEHRGGMAELINSIKTTKVPVLCTCNDRNNQKIRNLAKNCLDLKFAKPSLDQIKVAIMPICVKEEILMSSFAVDHLISGCNHDLRQILNSLSIINAGNEKNKLVPITNEQARKEAEMAQKTSIKMNPWEVCRKVFSKESQGRLSIEEKADLYFHNTDLSGIFIHENYLHYKPVVAIGNKLKEMELMSKCLDSISEGDLVETVAKSGMNWNLLPTAAVFCSVVPGDYMSGKLFLFL